MKTIQIINFYLFVFMCLFAGSFILYTVFVKLPSDIHEISSILKDVNTSIEHLNNPIDRCYKMRITGYTPTGNKTALMEDVQTGWTAAVSPKCMFLLGTKVYVEGHGIRYINDLTHKNLDEEFDVCTLDLAVPTKTDAHQIGNKISTVVKLKDE